MFRSASNSYSGKYSLNNILSSFISKPTKKTGIKGKTRRPLPRSATETGFTQTPDFYKFQYGFASYVHHGGSRVPVITSFVDLTDSTSCLSLLPRRRIYGNPYETLSIKNGDDAMIVSPNLIGVADGVSGWSGEHANSGLFSRSFLENISRNFTDLSYTNSGDLTKIKEEDFSKNLDKSFHESIRTMSNEDFKGSSTLLISMIIDKDLKIMNIGDSKIFIIRDGEIVFTNQEQYISALCPQQVGTTEDGKLPSSVVQYMNFEIAPDDLILICSDGVTDNLYPDEILDIINKKINKDESNLQDVAASLLYHAKSIAYDNYCVTPYVEKINELNKEFITGGKLDDISICVSKVVLNI